VGVHMRCNAGLLVARPAYRQCSIESLNGKFRVECLNALGFSASTRRGNIEGALEITARCTCAARSATGCASSVGRQSRPSLRPMKLGLANGRAKWPKGCACSPAAGKGPVYGHLQPIAKVVDHLGSVRRCRCAVAHYCDDGARQLSTRGSRSPRNVRIARLSPQRIAPARPSTWSCPFAARR
jgi:hypothetical protein